MQMVSMMSISPHAAHEPYLLLYVGSNQMAGHKPAPLGTMALTLKKPYGPYAFLDVTFPDVKL